MFPSSIVFRTLLSGFTVDYTMYLAKKKILVLFRKLMLVSRLSNKM